MITRERQQAPALRQVRRGEQPGDEDARSRRPGRRRPGCRRSPATPARRPAAPVRRRGRAPERVAATSLTMTASVGPGRSCRLRRETGTRRATRRGRCYRSETTGTPRGQLPARSVRSSRRPHPGGSMFTSPDEVAAYIRDNDVEFVDVRFCDLPGVMQHFTIPASTFGEDTFSDGPRLRRLLDPRVPGDQRVGHAAAARRQQRLPRPVPPAQDAERQLLHPRPDHPRGLQPRPAQRREEGRGLPRQQRHRRHRLLRPRGGVLHLRLRPARHRDQRGLLPHRLGRGLLELRLATGENGGPTWATRPAPRAATSRSRPTTTTATCARR